MSSSLGSHLGRWKPPSPHLYKPISDSKEGGHTTDIQDHVHVQTCHQALAHILAGGSRTPNALFNLLTMSLLGMALPDSYSLITDAFSLMAVASLAWFICFAIRACIRAFLNSDPTVACLNAWSASSTH